MAQKKNEIFRDYDSFGVVQVCDDGNKRTLLFGGDDHQSCMLNEAPAQLQFEYTRAMALVMLFSQSPKQALLLGLGGGSLASFLYAYQEHVHITAVELRHLVIDVAYRYFELPRDERLSVIEENAQHFLQHSEPANFDLVMSDIYTSEGVDTLQHQERYIDMVRECLNEEGWLVLNCWSEHRADRDLLSILRRRFKHIYSCHTQSGNWVLIAGCENTVAPGKLELRRRATAMSAEVGFSVLNVLKKLSKL